MVDALKPFVQLNTRSQDLNRVQDRVASVFNQLSVNPWVNGEIGAITVSPADLDTGAFADVVSNTTHNIQKMLIVVPGTYMISATVQFRTGDNSTATTGSHDFTVSAEGSDSMVGALVNSACVDYGSVYLDTVSGSTSGEISQASLNFPLIVAPLTALYLNAQSQFTGSAVKVRGFFMALRVA